MPGLRHSFDYQRPKTLDAALKLVEELSRASSSFVFCAGGTDLIPHLKLRHHELGTVISLSAIAELQAIAPSGSNSIQIGALATLADLRRDPHVTAAFPGLARAAATVASPQIRIRATVGGNLLADNRCVYFNLSEESRGALGDCFKTCGDACHLVPSAQRGVLPLCRARFVSDLAPVLMALDAQVHLRAPRGSRTVNLREFYKPDGIDRTCLRGDEILTHIHIPIDSEAKSSVAYQKLRIRNAIDFPSVGVAVGRKRLREKTQWSVAVTGINTHPIFARGDAGEAFESDVIEKAIAEVGRAASPLRQDFFPPAYRRKMIPVLIRRAVAQLLAEE